MARCTAPVKGHRTSTARASCPACGGTSGRVARTILPPGRQAAGDWFGYSTTRRPEGWSAPDSPQTAVRPSPALPGGRYTWATLGYGASTADLLLLLLLARVWEGLYAELGGWAVLIVTVLVLLPFVVSAALSRHCTAWNASTAGRCAKVRPQPLRRCEVPAHSHSVQLLTAHEAAAAVCFLVGLLGSWIVLGMVVS